MIPVRLSTLSQVLSASLVGEDTEIRALSSDSRKIEAATLFVALRGERFDGHDFGQTALDNGAVALLVERELPLAIAQLIVPNSQKAMGIIGAWVRDQVNPVCVALTGSNGKTSVKEMLATILSRRSRVLFTAGNFNNEIGVPLTLLRLSRGDEYGVFELGANHKGEIDYTSSLVRPAVALVNNIGSAHLEGFGSIEGVAAAKSEIYGHLSKDGVAIINADDRFADTMRAASQHCTRLSFGIEQAADVSARALVADDLGCYRFEICHGNATVQVTLPLAGRHQVYNALAAASCCIALGLSLAEIGAGLESLLPVKGRMVPTLLGRVRLIDDSYNANPSSVGAAIAWLHEICGHRCLVLGDLAELGDNAAPLHAQVGDLARSQGIEAVFTLGTLSEHCSRSFGGSHFTELDALVKHLIIHINQHEGNLTLLVKGSRSAAMERVVEALVTAYGRGEFV
jgi:UDP-N-acetylmuramoyl-tripeptide--D-alanyl-D-alanine ligase